MCCPVVWLLVRLISMTPVTKSLGNMFDIFFIFCPDTDIEAMPHEAYVKVETKDGLVVNKPRIITRHQQQPTSHTCMLDMGYLLQASGAGKHYVHGVVVSMPSCHPLACP